MPASASGQTDQPRALGRQQPMQLPLCVTLGRSNDGDHLADDGQQVAQRRDRDRHSGVRTARRRLAAVSGALPLGS